MPKGDIIPQEFLVFVTNVNLLFFSIQCFCFVKSLSIPIPRQKYNIKNLV